MRSFLLLWITQAFSGLGSALTSYALVLWSYTQEGSALLTAMLMVCSYAPYVICSIFAGAFSDRWNKKVTMLVCDAAAVSIGKTWNRMAAKRTRYFQADFVFGIDQSGGVYL